MPDEKQNDAKQKGNKVSKGEGQKGPIEQETQKEKEKEAEKAG